MTTTRRQFLGSAVLAAAPPARPNILVVMSDQESALLPGPVKLPNRERIASRGVSFTSAFCNTPQCSAARSALLTGMEPHQTGVVTNVDGQSIGKGLPHAMPNVGSVFQAAGYSTGYFGKWHLGGSGPSKFGFGASSENGSDEAVAREAAAWIKAQRTPWLAWVSVLNPHHIYEIPALKDVRVRPGVKPPASDLRNLAGKPDEQRQYVDKDQGRQTREYSPDDWVRYRSYYCELVEKVDGCLGTVLDAAGDLNSTIVVYTADHGDALGEHGLPFKGPFLYEELIRIPLVIAAPGKFTGGKRGEMVTQCDVAPTLASLAGVAWPSKTTGRDLTVKAAPRDAVFLEYYSKQKWVNPIRTIRTRRWKLNWYDRGNKELYDLNADPHEMVNLAGNAAFAKVQADLEKRVADWRAPLTKA